MLSQTTPIGREAQACPTRVVIVDDSQTIRRFIRMVLEASTDIEVVGDAANAQEARQVIKTQNPDIITLDVEMPGMSGIDFLERLMALRPLPVVMISSVTRPNSEQSVQALSLGAVEIFPKPGHTDQDRWNDLPEILRAAAQCRPKPLGNAKAVDQEPTSVPTPNFCTSEKALVAIGASTGGVDAIETILRDYPKKCPPTVVVQHMPDAFLESFASRLDSRYPFDVKLAYDGAPLNWGCVYVAPGGAHHLTLASNGQTLKRVKGDKVSGHRPSVDVFFESVAQVNIPTVAALMTGMGRDGAQGLCKIAQSGCVTLAQSEASCVVYGMPRAAVELGAVDRSVDLRKMGREILQEVSNLKATRWAKRQHSRKSMV